MRAILILLAALLAASLAYLPFELRGCDRLVAAHGPKFFCPPTGFLTIPVLTASLAAATGVAVWSRWR